MGTVSEVFLEEGYASVDELFRGWALMTALAKQDQYRAECERFEQKYGVSFDELESSIHATKGQEAFDTEDDLVDWEFALQALTWWRAKVEELQLANRS